MKKTMQIERTCAWTIIDKTEETPSVTSLYLQPKAESVPFYAGQYLTIRLQDCGPTEGKAYSISSAPHEPHIRITLRRIGSYSNAIADHTIGDELVTSPPYGFFYPDYEDLNDIVCIAGGIGITPLRSIIAHLIEQKNKRTAHLLYSNKYAKEVTFKSELERFAAQNTQFIPHYFLTQETTTDYPILPGRITKEHVRKHIPNCEHASYLICGSMEFTQAMWHQLRALDIPHYQIYTEGFF